MTLISTLSQPCTGHRSHRIKPLLAKMNKKTWLADGCVQCALRVV